VTATAGGGLLRGDDATELGQNSGRSDRIEEEHFPETALSLGCLEARVWASIGKPRLRKVGILRWHHQLLDSTDLLVNEPAQLCRAVALSGGDAARQGNEEEPGRSSAGYQLL
jgi:hypothetical protein